MNIWLEILLAGAFLAFLYGIYCLMAVCFARYEVKHSRMIQQKEETIEIFAEAEALEYYVRVAMTASGDRTPVVAYIQKDAEEWEEMVDIAKRLQREYPKFEFRLI